MGCFFLIIRIIYTPYKQLRHTENYKVELNPHRHRIITWSITAIQQIFVEHLLCARYRATRDIAVIKTDKIPALMELTVYQKRCLQIHCTYIYKNGP